MADTERTAKPEAKGAPATGEPLLPPRVREWLDRIGSIWSRLPLAVRLFVGALGISAIVVTGYYLLAPVFREQAVLYSQLEPDDAAAIVEKLKAQKIPFELAADGTTIRVPKDKVDEIRLSMAAAGLPRGGQVGFETFENLRLGATEFEQQVTYRRAMEGELARTIATVRSIQSARVHLVLPRKSVFAQRTEPASASIVVRLRASTLPAEEVAGVVNLVASAVPGLEADRITLVTTDGTMLHRPKPLDPEGKEREGLSPAEEDQLAQARGLEALLEERTRTMLERVLGPGHVDVRVRAEIDTAKVETTSDKFNHDKSTMRSEQQTVETTGGGAAQPLENTVAGVPGAEANLPGGQAVVGEAGEAAAGQTVRRSHTRNFEIDRVQEHRTSVTQSVKRLAVAVVVDGAPGPEGASTQTPRSEAEVEKLAQLVRSTVGFDEERGDVVTVESVPFHLEALPEGEPAGAPTLLPLPESVMKKYGKWLPLAKVVGAVLGGAVLLLMMRRYLRKRGIRLAEQRLAELRAAERMARLQLEAADAEQGLSLPGDYRAEALRRAAEDPATAALVMQHWLGTAAARLNEPQVKAA